MRIVININQYYVVSTLSENYFNYINDRSNY